MHAGALLDLIHALAPAATARSAGASLLLEGQPQGPGLTDMLLPLLAIVAIFWFLVFRPESRKRKERESKVRALRKGDDVVTTGGILGRVAKVDEKEVVLVIDKGKDVRVRFAKSAVFDVLSPTVGESSPSGASEETGERTKV